MLTRKGHKPKQAIGVLWDSCNDDPDDALHGWRIYLLSDSTASWINIKVVSQRSRRGAANYWLGWNQSTKDFAHSAHTYRMPEAMRERIAGILRDPHMALTADQAATFMSEVEAEDRAAGPALGDLLR